jgi:hypothetical protein
MTRFEKCVAAVVVLTVVLAIVTWYGACRNYRRHYQQMREQGGLKNVVEDVWYGEDGEMREQE